MLDKTVAKEGGASCGEAAWTSGWEARFNSALTTNWICITVIPSFNSSPTLVNSQLVSVPPVGILTKFVEILVSTFSVTPKSTEIKVYFIILNSDVVKSKTRHSFPLTLSFTHCGAPVSVSDSKWVKAVFLNLESRVIAK